MHIPKLTIKKQRNVRQPMKGENIPLSRSEQQQTKNNLPSIPIKYLVFAVVIIGVFALAGLANSMIRSFITWDDTSQTVNRKDLSEIQAPDQSQYTETADERSTTSDGVQVNGRITVVFTKDKGVPYEDGEISLKRGGALITKHRTSKSGVVVFDEVPAGTYSIEGTRVGEARTTKTTVTLGPGEITTVQLALYLDTPVTITVHVTDAAGEPEDNEPFQLVRKKSDEEDERINVQTNDEGVFTQSGVFPDDRWKLFLDGTEIASVTVEPTGKNQEFHISL